MRVRLSAGCIVEGKISGFHSRHTNWWIFLKVSWEKKMPPTGLEPGLSPWWLQALTIALREQFAKYPAFLCFWLSRVFFKVPTTGCLSTHEPSYILCNEHGEGEESCRLLGWPRRLEFYLFICPLIIFEPTLWDSGQPHMHPKKSDSVDASPRWYTTSSKLPGTARQLVFFFF